MTFENTAEWIWKVIGIGVVASVCAYCLHLRHLDQTEELRSECVQSQKFIDKLKAFQEAVRVGAPMDRSLGSYADSLEHNGILESRRHDGCISRLRAAEQSFF